MKLHANLCKISLISAVLLGVAGCQTIKPTEASMKERAQTVIGKPVSKIDNIRNDSTLTYYTAYTPAGEYNCELPSGVIVAVAGMGIMKPPLSCLPKGASPIPLQ
ncbi:MULTISPECIES: hypothetical protein [Pseudomonas]|jgi:hypothetical protein|uniref:Lipoprotein n=2 Tax=Pseudomonas TaxID=286 RepID=A0A370SDX0_PSEJE|nr:MULTISPECIES: hypothetical protein [Pseudomonas]MBA4287882.1 tRNA (N6-isopentenyl adenosine(37)-C2)-methylthiotransferase MiaB [Pseudomonas sp.]MCT8946739.1 hypothetical protein [Pseudomonas iridis]MDD1006974.1 hypothetical protein [Pseudomonas shahriarae]RDL17934.1 hypothetical protein DEU51_1103 [Pseudomonas jessenii]UHC81865.1 hypothetical protein LS633_26305 [Pseudomonas sp. NIBR-H-19]